MVVEVTEESNEAERVSQHNHVHGVRKVTVSEQVVSGVDGHGNKLELRRKRGKIGVLIAKYGDFTYTK